MTPQGADSVVSEPEVLAREYLVAQRQEMMGSSAFSGDTMNLLSIVDVDLKDQVSVDMFIDRNDQVHNSIFLTLLEVGVLTSRQPLSPYNIHSPDWLRLNYADHVRWSLELDIPLPQGMDEVDFRDPMQALDFISNHADHHALVAQALGL